MRFMVTGLRFKQSAIDHSIFIQKMETMHTIVSVATDDMAITSEHLADVKRFKNELHCYWRISNKGSSPGS